MFSVGDVRVDDSGLSPVLQHIMGELFGVIEAQDDEAPDVQLVEANHSCVVLCNNDEVARLALPCHLPALVRLMHQAAAVVQNMQDLAFVSCPKLRLSATEMQLLYGDDSVALTPGEYAILRCLAAADSAVERSVIMKALGSRLRDEDSNLLDGHLYRIRKKLGGFGLGVQSDDGKVQIYEK